MTPPNEALDQAITGMKAALDGQTWSTSAARADDFAVAQAGAQSATDPSVRQQLAALVDEVSRRGLWTVAIEPPAITAAMLERRGWIYVAECAELRRVKIGFAGNVSARIKALNASQSPAPITLIAARRGCLADEQLLHYRFRHDRVHGEWFTFGDEIQWWLDDEFLPAAERGTA